jgi:hypothetical protein
MKSLTTLMCISLLSLLSACSGEAPDAHVWKDQTDSIDKAREVGATLEQASGVTRQAVTSQSD